MEKNCKKHDGFNPFDNPETVAEWMRNKDYAFDFRGNNWSKDGGIEVEHNAGYVVSK